MAENCGLEPQLTESKSVVLTLILVPYIKIIGIEPIKKRSIPYFTFRIELKASKKN